MWRKKIMASLGIMLCLFASSTTLTYAETVVPIVDDEISLAYEIACNPISDLAIIDGTAYCTSSVGGTGNISITITQILQKYSGWFWIWNDVDNAEWTRTENRNSVRLSNSISGLDSGTYRVKSVFTLIDISGKSETITVYSDEQKVN